MSRIHTGAGRRVRIGSGRPGSEGLVLVSPDVLTSGPAARTADRRRQVQAPSGSGAGAPETEGDRPGPAADPLD
ncbi:hypothetical protein GCM10022222_77860 [Amycolatopsis ultiminotia]|uniref:Uncharacterized protein n=1 Tax=Amycolatopsis ultiminotia TaxID=543629 RepID=A0ABP6YF28_9PSEU